ncbi:MAG: cell division protein FtsH, partial [Ignavibacteriales bacterium]|nr:cell division protein FtsH [Ignavibacteriales bacterium]
TQWGMSDLLGPIDYSTKEEEVFLGREITRERHFGEDTQRIIDSEVKRIIELGVTRAETILTENLETLHRLAEVLLEREILDGEEIDKIIRGETLDPLPVSNNGDANRSKDGPEPHGSSVSAVV